jgi:hypothetical protein
MESLTPHQTVDHGGRMSEFLEDIGPIGWGIGLALVALCVVAVAATIQEQRDWETFSVLHACKVIGKMSGSSATTVAPVIGGRGGVSVGSTWIPGKTGYQCDDGVTYWR